jgi:hypothetical protein
VEGKYAPGCTKQIRQPVYCLLSKLMDCLDVWPGMLVKNVWGQTRFNIKGQDLP